MRQALQFLTIIPIRAPFAPLGESAIWFPVVGALIGILVAAAWATPMHATLAIVVAVLVTGGLHEDGLADVCDAVRAGRKRERMLEILKDSRIGTYGASALVLSILVRWQAMAHMAAAADNSAVPKIILAFLLSRASMVMLSAQTPTAAAGMGEAFRQSLPAFATLVVLLQCALAVGSFLFFGPRPMALAIGATAMVGASILASRWWFLARLGGITGDSLGFQCQVAECVALSILAWG